MTFQKAFNCEFVKNCDSTHKDCTERFQIKIIPASKRRIGHKLLPLICWESEISVLQSSVTVFIKHVPGHLPGIGVAYQHKMDFSVCVCLVLVSF